MESKLDIAQFSVHQKNITVSIAAWLSAYFPDEELWDIDLLNSFKAGISQACEANKVPTVIGASVRKADSRCDDRKQLLPSIGSNIKVYTNYEVAKDVINLPDLLTMVDSEAEADFILTVSHTSNFTAIPLHQRICQFPYESGFIRKVN